MSTYKNSVDYEYIQKFIQLHPDLKNKQIAVTLGVSSYNVSYARRRMKKYGDIPKSDISDNIKQIKPADSSTFEYNINPITYTTRLCICRWHYEGDTIQTIADVLNRPTDKIIDILSSCIKSGMYIKYNKFNRDESEVTRNFKLIKKAYDMNIISDRKEMEGAVNEFIQKPVSEL